MNLSERLNQLNDDERRMLAAFILHHAPIHIPLNADITTKRIQPHDPGCFKNGKRNGYRYRYRRCNCDRWRNAYTHVQFEWTIGVNKYTVRWHTKTPGAPHNQGIVWVLQLSTQHNNFVGIKSDSSNVSECVWIEKYEWDAAIRARQNKTATDQQLQLLADGHWEDSAPIDLLLTTMQ